MGGSKIIFSYNTYFLKALQLPAENLQSNTNKAHYSYFGVWNPLQSTAPMQSGPECSPSVASCTARVTARGSGFSCNISDLSLTLKHRILGTRRFSHGQLKACIFNGPQICISRKHNQFFIWSRFNSYIAFHSVEKHMILLSISLASDQICLLKIK
jgi:hypothetical protein